MRLDELRQPLRRRSLFERLWAKRPGAVTLAYALTACLFAAAATWAIRSPHPFAGEPIVTAMIPPMEEITTASTDAVEAADNVTEVKQTGDGPLAQEEAQGEAPAEPQQDVASVDENAPPDSEADAGGKSLVTIEQPIRQDIYKQEAGIVISPRRPLTAAPAKGFVELSGLGALPKLNGSKKPSGIYARPVSLNVIHSDSPKIAIVLGGMGLNAKLTARAVRDLPADVTLAFAPYGQDLQSQVDAARKEGHEVMLQVPLEPVGYPATNPGPRTLLADAGQGENTDSLYWHMSRFTGYVGLVNYMGGKFLANNAALQPVLQEMRKRGLLFLEDGSLPLSATSSTAKSTHAEARRANTVIDIDPNPQSIMQALQLLEQEAQINGTAIGTGAGLEVTIDAVREWAKEASERGIIIVPVSAAFQGRMG